MLSVFQKEMLKALGQEVPNSLLPAAMVRVSASVLLISMPGNT